MEGLQHHQQQQWWRSGTGRWRLSYKNLTLIVCSINLITALILLRCLFRSTSHQALYRHIKESEDIRRSMIPVDLIKRVREIREQVYVKEEQVQENDVKQLTAGNLVSRLNDLRSYSNLGSTKALEEWRKRKMERARLRSSMSNGR